MSRMLIGETDKDLGEAIHDWFKLTHDYGTQLETSGWQISDNLRSNQYDVVILNVILRGIDGITVVREYRASGGTTPIILIGGNHCSGELQLGLDAGADGYLLQPFLLSDLAAMVRSVLRRPEMRTHQLRWGGVVLDSASGLVTKNDVPVHLYPMEFKLLEFLLRHPNQPFSSAALAARVWHKEFGLGHESVRTHIRTLRQKLDTVGFSSVITTVRGFGYKNERQHRLGFLQATPVTQLIEARTLSASNN